MEVVLSNTPVMFVLSDSGTAGAQSAFDRLEAKLPSFKKRHFYGLLEGPKSTGVYRACVSILPGDDPKSLGLATWTIPGGKYARVKIRDWEKHLDQIGPSLEALCQQYECDPTRPTIEFYRSEKELFLLLPIRS